MEHPDSYRKIPKQARSQATVDVILEASARILEAGDRTTFNTNAIAELAGISVGTLYQYFSDKNAILIALARRELAATEKAVKSALETSMAGEPSQDPVRLGIQALLKGFKGRQKARKALIEALMINGLADELASPVDNVFQYILAKQSCEKILKKQAMTPVATYVVSRALIGTLRAALMEQSAYLGTPEFEDELVKLARLMLAR